MRLKDLSGAILVVKEKHRDRYFDVSTEEKLEEVCKSIYKKRQDEGWYLDREEADYEAIGYYSLLIERSYYENESITIEYLENASKNPNISLKKILQLVEDDPLALEVLLPHLTALNEKLEELEKGD